MMPEVPAAAFKVNLHLREIPSLFTVGTFARMVQEQLDLEVGVNVSSTADTAVPLS